MKRTVTRIPVVKKAFMFLVLLMAASAWTAPAWALDYESRWEGKLGGNDQFYIPQRVASGNLTRDPGDELLVIDNAGFAYFMGWRDGSLFNIWITSSKVAEGRVADLITADVDHCGTDEGVLLGPQGEFIILGGGNKDFKRICASCLPEEYDDFHGEFLAPAQADHDPQAELLILGTLKGAPWILIAEASGKKARVLKAAPLPDVGGEIMSLWPATNKPGDRFYVAVYRGAGGDIVVPLTLNEEGVSEGAAIPLKKAGMSVRAVFGADMDSDGREEMFVSGTSGKGSEAQSVMTVFNPDEAKPVFKPFPATMPDLGFLTAPDLNGDDLREIVLVSFNGKARVLSLATLSLSVNGKSKPVKNKLVLDKGRPYIVLDLFSNLPVKEKGKLVMIIAGPRTLVVDRGAGSATLKIPTEEEPRTLKMPVIKKGAVYYYDALALGEALGYKVQWDILTLTFSLKK